jgi:hypothetical protein
MISKVLHKNNEKSSGSTSLLQKKFVYLQSERGYPREIKKKKQYDKQAILSSGHSEF